jgi:hypothetical protein
MTKKKKYSTFISNSKRSIVPLKIRPFLKSCEWIISPFRLPKFPRPGEKPGLTKCGAGVAMSAAAEFKDRMTPKKIRS